ncbi:hypothetical protein Tco_1471505 [Tanacetum coccineum]
MGDENPIYTFGDYSKPSHEGYMNTIELPKGNNVVPLRSDTIRLVQNGCLFHGLRSEDPNQHLKDFLKLVDLLDLNGDNRERTRPFLFQFSLYDEVSNWLEHLPTGSVSTWEDLITCFLAQFFPPGRTAKLLQRLMEAYLAPKQPVQVNKISSSCKIYSSPYNTQYFMENPEQAFVDYASSRTDEAGGSTTAQMNFASTDHPTKEELQSKGIKKDEAEEEERVNPSATEYKDHDMTIKAEEEVEEESEEEFKEETEDETEEEDEDNPEYFKTFPTMKELGYHEWLLRNPRPPWVKAKISTGDLNNVKFSCMVGHFDKKIS